MATLFFLVVSCVLALVFLVPLLLAALVEKSLGGPRLPVHLLLNLVVAVWAVREYFFSPPNLHDPTPLLIFPAFLALAIFYLLVSPHLTPRQSDAFRRFRKLVASAYLICVGLFIAALLLKELS